MASETPNSEPVAAGPLGTTLRVGTIRSCRANEKARRPAYVLEIDFGPQGTKTSSAQLVDRYDTASLEGRQVIAAHGLGTKRIAGVKSEVLVLGVADEDGAIVLLAPEVRVPDGTLVH